MEHAELESKVMKAIKAFYELDSGLLERDASEWSMAHRLAVYLEREITGWNVDCEYNRQGLDRELKAMVNFGNVRPDITLHHRGHVEIEHNLLVIELKKNNEDADLRKASEYTRPPDNIRKFQYQYGLTLSLLGDMSLHWFMNGEELN